MKFPVVDMRRRFTFMFVLALFLSMFSFLRFVHASDTAIFVPEDFSSIQAAINNANPGDTIFVSQGVYQENIVVNKSITLIGENKNTTIIDGKGSGSAVTVLADHVSISGFTIQNSGSKAYESGVLVESNFNTISENIIANNGLTGVCLKNSFGSQLFGNNISDNSGYGIFLVDSSNNTIFSNVIEGNNGGIRLYSSNGNNVSRNVVIYDLLGGIYLFYASNNSLFYNIMRCNREFGLNLDYSSNNNVIVGNAIADNFKYGLLLGSVSNNLLRNNNMTGNRFNFEVVLTRPVLQDYLNDIDSSNLVDGKEIHYIINGRNLVIDHTLYPNIGYLALINSTGVTVKGLNLTGNGQALLSVFTTNSTIQEMNMSNNNNGIQLCSSSQIKIEDCVIAHNSGEGVTIDNHSSNITMVGNLVADNEIGVKIVHFSRNNTLVENNVTGNGKGIWIFSYSSHNVVKYNFIADNHVGISLQRLSPCKVVGNTVSENEIGLFLDTSGSFIFHNNFVNNTVQVEASNSSSVWDGGYSEGGNYWSNYSGKDANGDDVGDTPHFIDENNVDRYPLVSFWTREDLKPPVIGFPTTLPSEDVQPYEDVSVRVAVTDVGSGIDNVTMFYTLDNITSWYSLKMIYNSTAESFIAVLPGYPPGTLVKYKIVAWDRVGNVAVKDNFGQFFSYVVISEFNSLDLLLSFLAITVIFTFVFKPFIKKNTKNRRKDSTSSLDPRSKMKNSCSFG